MNYISKILKVYLKNQAFVYLFVLFLFSLHLFNLSPYKDTIKIQLIKENEFCRGSNTAQTHNIDDVYGVNIINERATYYWFESF